MKNPILAISLSAALASSLASAAPAEVKVLAAKAAGSACAASTPVTATVSGDAAELKVELPGYSAEAGAGKKSFVRLNCDWVVTLAGAAGWQLAPESFEYDVSGSLAAGAVADATYKFYYSGEQEAAVQLTAFKAGQIKPHAETVKVEQKWSTCGKDASIVQSLALKVRGSTGDSKLSIDKIGALRLSWRACKG